VFGIFSFISLIAASGRVWDAITDPLIAYLSDKSKNPRGRRTPFMRWSVFPLMIACILMYFPLKNEIANSNVWWLVIIQLLFYLFLTIYIIPYNALIAELGHTTNEKLRLSTLQSVAFFVGMVLASACPALAEFLFRVVGYKNMMVAYQYSVIIMTVFATIFLVLPSFFLNEKKYSIGAPNNLKPSESFKPVFTNKNFFLFIVADFAYFIGITIIGTGALYYVTVLLGLNQSFGTIMVGTMLLLSLACYPLVNSLARKFNKKILILLNLFAMGILFLLTYFLGRLPFAPEVQGILTGVLFAFPLAVLGIIPPVVLAEIAHLDAYESRQNKEAVFFAVRSLFDKFGQTFGIVIFTILTHNFGKDPGNDLGIRLSGIFGLILCFIAGIIFSFFNEKKVIAGIHAMEKNLDAKTKAEIDESLFPPDDIR
jgi:GPH family glycoside/pentoside/hexuronide:cation symporter